MRGTLAVALALFGLLWACSPQPVPHPERWTPEYGATDYPVTETYPASRKDAGAPVTFKGDAGMGERQ